MVLGLHIQNTYLKNKKKNFLSREPFKINVISFPGLVLAIHSVNHKNKIEIKRPKAKNQKKTLYVRCWKKNTKPSKEGRIYTVACLPYYFHRIYLLELQIFYAVDQKNKKNKTEAYQENDEKQNQIKWDETYQENLLVRISSNIYEVQNLLGNCSFYLCCVLYISLSKFILYHRQSDI